MEKEVILFRTKILIAIILAICIIFMYMLIGKSSAISGLNLKTDEIRKGTLQELYREDTIEGTIYDSKGVILSKAEKKGETGMLKYPEQYSWILGSNGNSQVSGLKGRFEEYLYTKGKDNKGADLTITIQNDLQQKAYDLIEGTIGSMIVMDVHTGKILALASSDEVPYNINNISDTNIKKWENINGFYLANGYKDKAEPGSVFKVVTATALIEHGMEDDKVNDEGSVILDDHKVINVNSKARGVIDVQQALGYSSNVYFAKKALELGSNALKEKGEDFLIGEKIELDFTELNSNYDFNIEKDKKDAESLNALVADTGYGQGHTLLTPLQIAMIFQSIGNEGEMMTPYLVKHIKFEGKTLYQGKKKVLKKTMSKDTAQTLKNMLQKVAADYYETDKKYNMCAKTGTAQIAGNKVKCYFASFNKDYVVVASKVANSGYGSDLKGIVEQMYQYLED